MAQRRDRKSKIPGELALRKPHVFAQGPDVEPRNFVRLIQWITERGRGIFGIAGGPIIARKPGHVLGVIQWIRRAKNAVSRSHAALNAHGEGPADGPRYNLGKSILIGASRQR